MLVARGQHVQAIAKILVQQQLGRIRRQRSRGNQGQARHTGGVQHLVDRKIAADKLGQSALAFHAQVLVQVTAAQVAINEQHLFAVAGQYGREIDADERFADAWTGSRNHYAVVLYVNHAEMQRSL